MRRGYSTKRDNKQPSNPYQLSQFLRALRLELQVAIVAYEAAQAEHCQPRAGQGICVGGDEVFFGLPVLVLAELASGYVLTGINLRRETMLVGNTGVRSQVVVSF
jgi:hypothetical protein